jgi:hypothetical protein
MKVGKDGKLKLSKDERQVGNFVYKNEPEHIKIMDINGSISVRISKTALQSGRLLDIQMQNKENGFLHNYAALLYNFIGVLMDEQFMVDAVNLCVDCVNRHKEFYGLKADITGKEDAEALQELKETTEAIEELKKEDTNEDSK